MLHILIFGVRGYIGLTRTASPLRSSQHTTCILAHTLTGAGAMEGRVVSGLGRLSWHCDFCVVVDDDGISIPTLARP